MVVISSLYIYAEPRSRFVDFEQLAAYAADRLSGTAVHLRGPLLEDSLAGRSAKGEKAAAESLALALAGSRIRGGACPPGGKQGALPGEIDYELRRLKAKTSNSFGILYDAHLLARLYAGLMPAEERGIDTVNVVFTNQLIGTLDDGDRRYHARTVLLGAPAVISVSGMVEAPARSRNYYLAQRGAESMGLGEEQKMELARSFAEDCLSHEDARLTEVAKGLMMQAVAYRTTGDAFCDDSSCRLYNAHWQSELLKCQLGDGPEFCENHACLFRN